MEDVLAKIVQHGANYAIRSGIALTSGYAINSCSRLLKSVKGTERGEIADLQARLESKINIISPPIDMIELIAARGNTTLDSALTLTKQIRMDMQELGVRLNEVAVDEERFRRKSPNAKTGEQMSLELKLIISDMKRCLARIEDAVPLLMLAITTSGASLSTMLPATVSPSRLLQASTFLSAGDANYTTRPGEAVQVGPVFMLSVYMLFAAHSNRPLDSDGITETTWKEVIRKARVKLFRVPLSNIYDLPSSAGYQSGSEANPSITDFSQRPNSIPSENKAYEFAYQLQIVEDLDDDRFHEDAGAPFDDVAKAGIQEIIPVHEISKIFYADTGKLLKIGSEGEANNPILLLKRDTDAVPPRRMMSRQPTQKQEDDFEHLTPGTPQRLATDSAWRPSRNSEKSRGFPRDLDPEWLALEVYTEAAESDDEVDEEIDEAGDSSPPAPTRSKSTDFLSSALSTLRLRNSPFNDTPPPANAEADFGSSQLTHPAQSACPTPTSYFPISSLPALRTSLSLLELLIRLTALQQFQQASHLTIHDEFLNFFLSGSASTGAGADTEYRKRVRRDARLRVGFDPYDESPIKQRGEAYIDQHTNDASSWDDHEPQGWQPWHTSSPGLRSPRSDASPSPSLRQQRGTGGSSMPKGRSQQLRQELGVGASQKRSPLSRSESDSTLGTSPRTPAIDAEER